MIWLNKYKFFNSFLPMFLSVVLIVVAVFAYLIFRPQTPVAQAGWYSSGGTWNYRKALTINHAKVNTATGTTTPLSNFPVLYSKTDPDLEYTGFAGGKVASSTGADIVFTDSDGISLLNYEIESYASSTGAIVAWIKIPSLPSTANYTIYEYFGNASAPAETASNIQNTWSNGYQGVWHLPNGTTLTASDSTPNANNGTITGAAAASGQIDGAGSFDGSSSKIDLGSGASLDITGNTLTLQAWVKRNASSSTGYIIEQGAVGTSGYSLGIGTNSCTTNQIDIDKNGVTAPCVGSFPADTNFHYLVVSWGAGGAAVYIDGAASGTSADTSSFVSSGSDPFIGVSSGGSSFFAGVIDEARISSVTRTADWAATEDNDQSSPSTFFSSTGSAQTQAPSHVLVRGGGGGGASGNTYTTSFPNTENPISESAHWINGAATGLDWAANVRTTAGLAYGTMTTGLSTCSGLGQAGCADSTAVLTGAWGTNQTAQATVFATNAGSFTGSEEVELRLRTSISAHSITGYEFNCSVKVGDPYMQIVRWDGSLGNFTQLKAHSLGCVTGDVIKATAIGSVLSVYKNGTFMFSTADTTYSGGSPGVGFYLSDTSNFDADYGFTNFTATDILPTGFSQAQTAADQETSGSKVTCVFRRSFEWRYGDDGTDVV